MGTVKKISAFVNAARVTLVPDGVAAYVAALWDRPGVVVTVGTGTVALVVDQSGRVRKLDGWGPQLGDVGSGYRVGLDGLIEPLPIRGWEARWLANATRRCFGGVRQGAGIRLDAPAFGTTAEHSPFC